MKGLSLIHGGIKDETIYFKKNGVPEFKIVDFSSAFFLDEIPETSDANNGGGPGTPDVIYKVLQARASGPAEKTTTSVERVDQWALGCLLFKLHFKKEVDVTDTEGSLKKVISELNLPANKYYMFRSLIS